jgi:hypothetical protein
MPCFTRCVAAARRENSFPPAARRVVFLARFCNDSRIGATLAQSVEQLIRNQQVVGSNPTGGSRQNRVFRCCDQRELAGQRGDSRIFSGARSASLSYFKPAGEV